MIALYVLISGLNKLSETLVISLKGFKYSTFFENLDFEWRDVVKIEVVTHIQRSEQTDFVISSNTEYIIHNSKKDLTLKEDKDWDRLRVVDEERSGYPAGDLNGDRFNDVLVNAGKYNSTTNTYKDTLIAKRVKTVRDYRKLQRIPGYG